jgi:S1-C subfamily serine protease
VHNLKATGAGARAGLRKGDVILAVNGRRVENLLDFEVALIDGLGAGTAEVAVERDGRPTKVTIPTHASGKRGKS